MEIHVTATNGERCSEERHRFRIGVDSAQATEFEATKETFLEELTNALIDHGAADRPGGRTLYLQVMTTETAKWRNLQNPSSGSVVAVTPEIVGQAETASTLFGWACNAVQMCRDIDTLADGLGREAGE